MEKSISELRKLVLEDKTVSIKPIVRPKPYLKKGHDGEHTYTGCVKTYTLPFDPKKRSYVNPFLSEDKSLEQEAFEKLLNQKEDSLNLYTFKVSEPNFWGQFTLVIPKEGLELNLGNPADALRYRVALANREFAKDQNEASIAEKKYVIVDNAAVKEFASQLGKKKSKAEDYMIKIKKSKKEMIDALRLLGKSPSKDADIDWLREELYKIKDEVTTTKGVAGLDKFIAVMEDSLRDTKIFVLDAIDRGFIVRDKNGYKLESSNKFIGRKFEELVEYFSSKDPKILEEKLIIQEVLKS